MGYEQITFKVLQASGDPKTDKWIDENEMKNFDNILEIVKKFNGSDTSVRIDTNCQDSHGRYEIFRSDGLTYDTWDALEPIRK